MKKNLLIKNAIFNMVYTGLNVLFPLVSGIYTSRVLLADGVGKISYAQNIASYFLLLAALGIPTHGVREIAKARDSKEEKNTVFTELFLINAFSTLICTVAYYVIICSFNVFQDRFVLHLIFGSTILCNLFNVDWFYKGEEEYQYIAIRSTLIKLVSLVALFLFVKSRDDYVTYAIILCVATAGNYFFNVINLRKHVKLSFRNLNFMRHLRPVIILVACTLATEIYSKVDTTMLGVLVGDDSVGYYTNAQKLVNTVITLSIGFTGVFLPRLSYYYAEDKNEFDSLVNIGFQVLVFITVPFCIGTYMVSQHIIPILYGDTFNASIAVLKVFSPLIIIKGVGDLLCYQAMVCANQEKRLVISYTVAALINVVLNALLIPSLEQNGAAIASVISELVVNGTLFVQSLKLFKYNLKPKFIYSVILSSGGMLAVITLINKLNLSNLESLLLNVLIGGGVYVFLNILCRNEVCLLVLEKVKAKKPRQG